MSLKYYKNYTVPYAPGPVISDDYWLEWRSICGKNKSCMTISNGIKPRRTCGLEDFFLLSMNKKRDVLNCYKNSGRREIYYENLERER